MTGKVIHYTEAPKLKVAIGERSWFRPLISKDDGAPHYTMRIFEIEEGGFIRDHQHPWEHELFVIEGEGEIRIGDKVYRVKPGDAIFIPENVVHSYRNVGKGVWRFICVIPHPQH